MRRTLAVGLFVALAMPGVACLPIWRQGKTVAIEEEEAIIVWDAAKSTQHFIRQIRFDSNAEDFGFVVPTPTQPEIHEASEEPFKRLRTFLENNFPAPPAATARFDSVEAEVKILDQKTVAGFDVAVLESNDSAALLGWMEKNGYEARPSLDGWLQRYLDLGWKISVFKYAGENGGKVGQVKPVRMSFKTDKPFFPYHEPSDNATAKPNEHRGRLLRVYYFGPEKTEANLYLAGHKRPWRDRLGLRSIRMPEPEDAAAMLEGAVPKGVDTTNLRFTLFQDSSVVRMSGDVYFEPPTED